MTARSQELLSPIENEEKTLDDLLSAVRGEQPNEDFEVRNIIPTPCFVVKTKDEAGKKVFINICGADEIPVPGDWSKGKVPTDVVVALKSTTSDDEEKEALRFPLSLGSGTEDVDKQGEQCIVYDCLFNTDVANAAKKHRRLKVFVSGLAIEWTGHKDNLKLSMEYRHPKMQYKGKEIRPHRVKVSKGPSIQEIQEPSVDIADQPVLKEKSEMTATVTYEERPVEKVVVTVTLPSNIDGGHQLKAWFEGFEFFVAVEGRSEKCSLDIPFILDNEKAESKIDNGHLIFCFPLKPAAVYLDELRREKKTVGVI